MKTKMDIIHLNQGNRLAHNNIGTAKSSITSALNSEIREGTIDPFVRSWGKPGPSSRVSSSEDDESEDGHTYQIKR